MKKNNNDSDLLLPGAELLSAAPKKPKKKKASTKAPKEKSKPKLNKMEAKRSLLDFSRLPSMKHPNHVVRCMAFDPGISKFGVAVVSAQGNTLRVDETLVVKTKPGPSDNARCAKITKAVDKLRRKYPIHIMGHELPFSQMGNNGGDSATLKQGQSLNAGYSAFYNIPLQTNPVFQEVPFRATEIKKIITGNGGAGKEYVQECVAIITGVSPDFDISEDEWDAIAIALCVLTIPYPRLLSVYAQKLLAYANKNTLLKE